MGRNYFCNATGCTDVATDLRLTFRGVRRLHIKDVPYHPTNDGFSQAYFGGDAEWKGGGSELVGSIADDEPIDWSGSAHIEFHCGFEVLIFAETVEATYRQTATLEGKTLEGKATE